MNDKLININKNINKNDKIKENIITEKTDQNQNEIMNLINNLKKNGKMMNFEERHDSYNKIVNLLIVNKLPLFSISTKLNIEYYIKICELYDSFIQQNSSKRNNIENNTTNSLNLNPKFQLKEDSKNKINENNNNAAISELDKRIREYKNKCNSFKEKTPIDNNKVNIFSNNNISNFNLKNEKDNNNNNYEFNNLFPIESKKELDEIRKKIKINNTNSSMDDNDKFYFSQNSVKDMKICLDKIKEKIGNYVNKDNVKSDD